jgi:hypothetical protein
MKEAKYVIREAGAKNYNYTKNNRKKRKQSTYNIISNSTRQHLIQMIFINNIQLKEAAKILGINYSTAKTILRVFRKEKRLMKKNKKGEIVIEKDNSSIIDKDTFIQYQEIIQTPQTSTINNNKNQMDDKQIPLDSLISNQSNFDILKELICSFCFKADCMSNYIHTLGTQILYQQQIMFSLYYYTIYIMNYVYNINV